MEGKKRVVPGEVCAVCSERGNHCRKIMLSAQKSAEVIVVERRRTKSIGVLRMTEEGGMTNERRKLGETRLPAER